MRALGRFLLWSLVGLVVVIGGLRLTVLRWWRVPDDDPYLEASIAPALKGGDWVLLWRLGPPPLGSLVMCPEPKHPERVVIGRLVGEPGETVKVDSSRLLVKDKAMPREGACANARFSVASPHDGSLHEQHCTTEVIKGLVHEKGEVDPTEALPVYEAEVGADEALLISDNRLFPYDSRDYGPVSREDCPESVFFRLIGKEGFLGERRFTYIR